MKTPFVIRVSTIAAVLAALALTTGCTTVQPWERGNLADYTKQADRDSLHATMTQHIYFSREASTGGTAWAAVAAAATEPRRTLLLP